MGGKEMSVISPVTAVRPEPGCTNTNRDRNIRTDRAVLTVSHTVVISIQVRQVALSLLLTAAELLLACCQTHNDNNNTL